TITRKKPEVVIREIRVDGPFVVDENRVRELQLTPRELEILGLIAQGLSNREIAERVFVSENTVKTHASRVFDKLGARRRTEAVQLGKAWRLSPGAVVRTDDSAGFPPESSESMTRRARTSRYLPVRGGSSR